MQGFPHTLTHAAPLDSPQTSRKESRRSQSCGNELVSCVSDNEILYKAIGYRPPKWPSVQMLECDEYPWASSEEGGNWKPDNERSRACVPRVQNNQGGACVEMLSAIKQNVGQMEPVEPSTGRVDMWAPWGKDTNKEVWYTTDSVGGVNNRLTEYDNDVPVPVGWSEAQWRAYQTPQDCAKGKCSWVFKRNYTFNIVQDASDGTDLWDATGKSVVGGKFAIRNANGYGSILCAVNIFGQDTYYKEPMDAAGRVYNALCYNTDAGVSMFTLDPLISLHVRADLECRTLLAEPERLLAMQD